MVTEQVVVNGNNIAITKSETRTIPKESYVAELQREINSLQSQIATSETIKSTKLDRIQYLTDKIDEINN